MATVTKWIGSNGNVLIPINQNADNSAPLYSTKDGVYYIAQKTTNANQGMLGLSLAFAAMQQ